MRRSAGPDVLTYVSQDDDRAARGFICWSKACTAAVASSASRRGLARPPAWRRCRLNFTTRRLTLTWRGAAEDSRDLVQALTDLGYRVGALRPDPADDSGDSREERDLLRALAVAGFAASNVMLLSVAVWAGAFEDMGAGHARHDALVLGADRPAGDSLRRPAVLPLGIVAIACGGASTWTCRSRWRSCWPAA